MSLFLVTIEKDTTTNDHMRRLKMRIMIVTNSNAGTSYVFIMPIPIA